VPKRLTRDTRHAVLGGVAAGFGRYLDVDPVLVRLGFVLLAFVNGLGVLFYLAGWLVMPRQEPDAQPGSPAPAGEAGTGFESLRETGARLAEEVRQSSPETARAQGAIGAILVLLGAVLLADNLGWLHWPYWARFETLWPLALVALGIGLIARSRRTSVA
jgi:phage shock protein PspC (stress-responsive transcriptional regulator)